MHAQDSTSRCASAAPKRNTNFLCVQCISWVSARHLSGTRNATIAHKATLERARRDCCTQCDPCAHVAHLFGHAKLNSCTRITNSWAHAMHLMGAHSATLAHSTILCTCSVVPGLTELHSFASAGPCSCTVQLLCCACIACFLWVHSVLLVCTTHYLDVQQES